jgi:hypothetical protein
LCGTWAVGGNARNEVSSLAFISGSHLGNPAVDDWSNTNSSGVFWSSTRVCRSFHDGFVFVGSEWQQLKQIGNAVPPLLAFAAAKVARQILLQFDEKVTTKSVKMPVQSILPAMQVHVSE